MTGPDMPTDPAFAHLTYVVETGEGIYLRCTDPAAADAFADLLRPVVARSASRLVSEYTA